MSDLKVETRRTRFITLLVWLTWAWVAMTVSHELGHVLAGLVAGARVVQLELRPWHLPHSLLGNDSHPLVTLWAGPVLGCAFPILAAATTGRPACWFIAWFCLLANASYLLLGYLSGDDQLDSARMIAAGSRPIEIVGAAAVALPIGYMQFRRSCIDLIRGKTPAMSPRGLRISVAALLVTVGMQAVVGTLIVKYTP
jgi:hypothetical protein